MRQEDCGAWQVVGRLACCPRCRAVPAFLPLMWLAVCAPFYCVCACVRAWVVQADLKKRIESLIDREYLERDERDTQVYNYLA